MIRTILALLLLVVMCGPLSSDTPEKWWHKLPRPSWSRFEKISQSQNWFEVYKIQPDIFAIYESGQWEEVISYLIIGSEKSILFDTGLGIGDMKKLTAELGAAQPIVINSHSHYDHVGGNFQFSEIFSVDTGFSKINSKGKSQEDVKEFVSEGWIWKETPKEFSASTYSIKPFRITRFLRNGERIDLGGRTLEVVLTPGHSPDSLCLLDRKNRLLLTGDTFYPAPLYAHFTESDFGEYAKTASMIAQLEPAVDYLLPSHNQTLLPSSYLGKLNQAFQAIQKGSAQFKTKDKNREYVFDGFAIIVPED